MKKFIVVLFLFVTAYLAGGLPKKVISWRISRKNYHGKKKPMSNWAIVGIHRSSPEGDHMSVVDGSGIWNVDKLSFVDVFGRPFKLQ